jgi:DNA polymerase theta
MEHGQLGIWHKTTVQQLHGSSQNGESARLWKAKRSLPPLEGGPADRTDQNKRPRTVHGRAKELPGLKPSAIDVLQGVSNGTSEYSQRNALLATPSSTADPLLGLSHRVYGLPPELVANFHAVGIKMMYPWQKQCLLGPGILDGEKNLVYSAPTGGGKSLVADLLMIKRLLSDRGAKAILVLPFVALVQEKVRWLRMIFAGISRSLVSQPGSDNDGPVWRRRTDAEEVRVVGCFGGGKSKINWNDFDIAVCTIEKVRDSPH